MNDASNDEIAQVLSLLMEQGKMLERAATYVGKEDSVTMDYNPFSFMVQVDFPLTPTIAYFPVSFDVANGAIHRTVKIMMHNVPPLRDLSPGFSCFTIFIQPSLGANIIVQAAAPNITSLEVQIICPRELELRTYYHNKADLFTRLVEIHSICAQSIVNRMRVTMPTYGMRFEKGISSPPPVIPEPSALVDWARFFLWAQIHAQRNTDDELGEIIGYSAQHIRNKRNEYRAFLRDEESTLSSLKAVKRGKPKKSKAK